MALLDVQNLGVRLQTNDGQVDAVGGISFHIDPGIISASMIWAAIFIRAPFKPRKPR